MTKQVFLAAVIFGFVGFGAGIFAHRLYRRPVDELFKTMPLSSQALKSVECVSTLRLLRAGDTDGAIRILETRLDGTLIGLDTLYQTASAEAREQTHADAALRLVQDYRRTNPHQPDVRYADAVARALAIPTESR